jgi:hypothetical protein
MEGKIERKNPYLSCAQHWQFCFIVSNKER